MKLTARQVDTAKPREKDYKLPDGAGLFLLVKTTGARYWRYRYTFAGKERLLALGVYPAISLSDAWQRRDEARKLVAAGVDPVQEKADKTDRRKRQTSTILQDIASEWVDFKKQRWGDSYVRIVSTALSSR